MIENDFSHAFWLVGRAILQGQNPYGIPDNANLPATNYFFVPFALLPLQVSFPIWIVVNILILFYTLREYKLSLKSLIWLGYAPVFFVLAVGQIDLVFLGLASFLEKKGWAPVIAAALITLKPQMAFVLLPWVLLNWLFKDWRQLVRWGGVTLALHLSPLLFDPLIYQKWWASAAQRTGIYNLNSPGLFSLGTLGVPLAVLLPIVLLLYLGGFYLGRRGSIITSLLALPFGFWYNQVLLVKNGPALWLVITSWIAFGLAYLLQGSYPFILIPLVALYFAIRDRKGAFRLPWANESAQADP